MTEFDASNSRFASPMERLLYLRSTSDMTDLRGNSLATMAQLAREVFVRAGTVILSPEKPQTHIYFVVEGEVTVRLGDVVVQHITPPGAIGFYPMLGQGARQQVTTADTACQLLAVPVGDVMELFEEDSILLSQAIRGFMGLMAVQQAKIESAGLLERTEPDMGPDPGSELDFVQRLRRLRVGPYSACSLDALADLAMHAEEIRYAPGDVIWREGERGDFGLNIVHGIVDCEGTSPARRFAFGADSTVGSLQAMAQMPRGYTCTARTGVVALRADVEALHDIIEDHPDFGLTVLSFLADVLFQLHATIAREGID